MFKRNAKLTRRAHSLRKDATKEEKHLWYDFLSQYPVRFRRQMVLQNFIADFYCPSLKIVIELDGSQHYEKTAIEYDNYRTKMLESAGCHVFRYSNQDVNENFEGVCMDIHQRVQQYLKEESP